MLRAVYLSLGEASFALEEQSSIANLMETTAAPLLGVVWDCVQTARWEAAERVLTRAAQIDPADPRVAAYRGVVLAGLGKTEDALTWFRVAQALREALRRLEGVGPQTPLRPASYGLDMAIRMRMARALSAAGRYEEMENVLAENVALEPGLGRTDLETRAFWPMLPDTNAELNLFAEFDTPLAFFAWSRVGIGSARLALKKYSEAIQMLQVVVGYDDIVKTDGSVLDRVRKARGAAGQSLAYAYLATNNLRLAKKWNGNADLLKEIEKRIETVTLKIAEDAGARLDKTGRAGGRREWDAIAEAVSQILGAKFEDNIEENWRSNVCRHLAQFRKGLQLRDNRGSVPWNMNVDKAMEGLLKLAIESGYPAESLKRDLEKARDGK
jgi:tetratricopeptide (TPR) repeat protein